MTLRNDWVDEEGQAVDAAFLNGLADIVNPLANAVAAVAAAVVTTSDKPTSATAQTQITSIRIPAGTLKVGSAFRVVANGVQGAGFDGGVIAQIHLGTAGSIADPVVCSNPAQFVGQGTGMATSALIVVRSIGSGGAAIGELMTVVVSGAQTSEQTTTVAINTTDDLFLTLSVATSAGVFTVYTSLIEQVA